MNLNDSDCTDYDQKFHIPVGRINLITIEKFVQLWLITKLMISKKLIFKVTIKKSSVQRFIVARKTQFLYYQVEIKSKSQVNQKIKNLKFHQLRVKTAINRKQEIE